MSKIKLLTQDNCPKCVQLQQFLEYGLRNQYVDNIEVIKKEEKKKEFFQLVKEHGLMSTPVLIYEDQVLVNMKPSSVSEFLKACL